MTDQVLKGDASLADEIVQILRGRIVNGEYSIGEKLVENRIAEELKVSRTPVREAFKQLKKENLIEYIPNKGCFAKGFEAEDLKEIYAVGNAVERLAVKWAIKGKTEEDMAELRGWLEEMRRFAEEGDTDRFLAAHEQFDYALFQMTKGRFITQALRSYEGFIKLARKGIITKQESLQIIQKEHEDICEAIERDDIEGAQEAITVHLINAAQRAGAKIWL